MSKSPHLREILGVADDLAFRSSSPLSSLRCLKASFMVVVVVVVVVFGVQGIEDASRGEIQEAEGVMLPLGFGSRLVRPDSDGSGDP